MDSNYYQANINSYIRYEQPCMNNSKDELNKCNSNIRVGFISYTLECGHIFDKKECIKLASSYCNCCFICDLQITNRESYYLICGKFNENIDEFYIRQEQIIEQLKKNLK